MRSIFYLLALCTFSACAVRPLPVTANREVQTILNRMALPAFPEKTFDVQAYGAVPDGVQDARKSIQNAIEACHVAGGGRVLVPQGIFFCDGPLHLRSNVNLHLEEGAVLRFGVRPESYTPLVKVRWEGTVCYNYSPLIYAYQARNIAITGKGMLDGQASAFWFLWKRGNDGNNQDQDKPVLRQMGNDGVAEEKRIFGNGFFDADGDGINDGDGQPHYLRPSLVEFFECENILLEDFTASDSPFWTIHPVFCRNVFIRRLTIEKGTTNDDGIDPDSCEDVLIEDCIIDTDDDPISIKAGRDQDAWNRPGSRHIVVRNCRVSSKVGNAFCIGSEMSGGVENVYVQNYQVSRTDNGVNFKCNLDRGGFVRNIYLDNISIDTCTKHGVLFQMDYHGYRGGNFPPDFQSFRLRNVRIRQAGSAGIRISGVEGKPVRRVHLQNIWIGNSPKDIELQFTEQIRMKRVRAGGRPVSPLG